MLQLFYGNPNRSFYVREITRKIDEQINSVRRELANLLSIGIISSDTNNNRLYYEVNQTFEHYPPLAAIFGSGGSTPKAASAASAPDEQSALQSLGNMSLAVLTGQLTRDERSGIDVLLVGDLNQSQVANYILDMEGKEGKELRYVVMDDDEFRYRQEVNDRFLALVLGSKMQVLMDKSYLITLKPPKKKANKDEQGKEDKADDENGGDK